MKEELKVIYNDLKKVCECCKEEKTFNKFKNGADRYCMNCRAKTAKKRKPRAKNKTLVCITCGTRKPKSRFNVKKKVCLTCLNPAKAEKLKLRREAKEKSRPEQQIFIERDGRTRNELEKEELKQARKYNKRCNKMYDARRQAKIRQANLTGREECPFCNEFDTYSTDGIEEKEWKCQRCGEEFKI